MKKELLKISETQKIYDILKQLRKDSIKHFGLYIDNFENHKEEMRLKLLIGDENHSIIRDTEGTHFIEVHRNNRIYTEIYPALILYRKDNSSMMDQISILDFTFDVIKEGIGLYSRNDMTFEEDREHKIKIWNDFKQVCCNSDEELSVKKEIKKYIEEEITELKKSIREFNERKRWFEQKPWIKK